MAVSRKSSQTYTVNNYLINPPHKINVKVIGAGGNGSLLLTLLARMHLSLNALNHPGLKVTIADDDKVEKHNPLRQAFGKHDVGYPKAQVLCERINIFYGLNWRYELEKVNSFSMGHHNIIITCTDSTDSRKDVKAMFYKEYDRYPESLRRINQSTFLYWIDIGNLTDRGQIVLASVDRKLPDVIDLFGDDYKDPPEEIESCSLAGAVHQQDLCINTMMAAFTQKLLWDMFTTIILDYHGFLINLTDLTFTKIPICTPSRKKRTSSTKEAKASLLHG